MPSDLHTGNLLQSLGGHGWLLADFGNADWEFQEGTDERTKLSESKYAAITTVLFST